MIKIHSRFDLPPSPSVEFTEPSITEQSHRSECNINSIMSRFMRTGVLGSDTQAREMFFGDFSDVGSFHDVQNIMADAREKFTSLPANIREAFGNDISKFLDALRDRSQIGKLLDLGLIKQVASDVATAENPVNMELSAEQKQAVKSASEGVGTV